MNNGPEKSRPGETSIEVFDARICIVAARFNDEIVTNLLRGALGALERHGVTERATEVIRVPGAFELPLTVQTVANEGMVDGVVALGAVIRGQTPHFEFVSGECLRGLSMISLQYDLPVGMGVLTVDSIEQAVARSGDDEENKGTEAALATLEMAALLRARRG